MILDVVQISNGLCSASFVVKREEEKVGSFSVQGSLASMEAVVQGYLNNQNFTMSYDKRYKNKDVFKPYRIIKNNQKIGVVYQSTVKTSLLKSYNFSQLKYSNKTYSLYPIGMGKAGMKAPIYVNDVQIGEIDEECTICDGLHKYKVYVKDETYASATVWMCIAMYVTGTHGSEEWTTKEKTINHFIDTNKELKSKYNPDFIDTVEK